MIFHIAVCSPDSVLRSRVERQCLDYYARRDDACIIEQLDSPEALLARDDAGERYELYLIELPSTAAAASLRAAAALRSRGRRSHVLRAMGVPGKTIAGALRVSIGRDTTEVEADALADALENINQRGSKT